MTETRFRVSVGPVCGQAAQSPNPGAQHGEWPFNFKFGGQLSCSTKPWAVCSAVICKPRFRLSRVFLFLNCQTFRATGCLRDATTSARPWWSAEAGVDHPRSTQPWLLEIPSAPPCGPTWPRCASWPGHDGVWCFLVAGLWSRVWIVSSTECANWPGTSLRQAGSTTDRPSGQSLGPTRPNHCNFHLAAFFSISTPEFPPRSTPAW
jgi:hypothetical protein